ncbi:MAG: fibronectin type III domain-containing protein, partial [Patescibacteria group bacterium]
VTLTITDSTNATGTKYGITTDGGTTWLNGSGATTTTATYSTSKTWTHTGLTGAAAYSYQVRIISSAERTYLALLTAVSVTTAPAVPTALAITTPSATSLALSWTAPSGTITSYTVSYGTTSSADTSTATGITSASTTLSSLTAGTLYYVKVRAHNATGSGPYTAAITRATPPATLTAPKSSEGTLWSNKATVAWPVITGAASYRLSYGTNSAGDSIGVLNIDTSGNISAKTASSTLSTTLTGLTPSTTYYWKVAAVTSDGTGAYSSVSSFTTPAAVLGLLMTPDRITNSNVRVVDATGKQIVSFFAYGSFKVKVKAITADLNGDGTLEIVTATQNPGAAAQIRIFDNAWKFKANLYPFGTSLKGGTDIATGDFDGDGVSELAVVPLGSGNASNLRVYDYGSSLTTAPSLLAWRFAFDAGTRKGATVYSGDVNGDRKAEIVVLPRDTHPNIQVFTYNASTKKLDSFGYVFPYGKTLPKSAKIALADVDGNGGDEIITVPNAGTANIQVYTHSAGSNEAGVRRAFKRLVWATGFSGATRGGFEVAAADTDGNGKAEVVISAQKGLTGQVQTFGYSNSTLNLLETLSPYGSSYRGGVHVAMFDVDQDQKAELITAAADGFSANTRIYSYGSRLEQNVTTFGWNLDKWFYGFASADRIGAQLFR